MAKRKNEVKVGGGALNAQSLQIVNGIVKAYFPRIGLYLVSLKGQAEAKCYSINYSGGMGLGAYTKGTYSPGESVFCIFNEKMGEGFIIGAHPRAYDSLARNINYPVSGESTVGLNQPNTARCGLLAGPLSGCTNEDGSGIDIDDHCAMPDLSTGGSFSISSETGIRFFVDSYSLGLQCDDATGMWVYSDDSYIRQSSINFQQIAGGKVEEDYNDNGELNETVGHSMFSWELLGQTEKPTADTIKVDPRILRNQPLGSAYFVDENAKPFHRVVEYGGYLGHGYQRVVNAPPKTKPDSYNYGEENQDQYCLSRIAQFADGDVSIESAKSIILTKRCYIPSVQTLQVTDDLDGGIGDSSKESKGEYDFSHGDVKLKASPEFNIGDTTCELLQELTALIDYQTYLLNYKLVHPFIYHKKDYFVNEEYLLDGMPRPQYSNWFSTLKHQQFAETPDELELDIHEKLKSTYYASESGLALLPEGGVSLYGGYGEEVRMGAGTSTISAPGDIWIKAGRNIHLWAGNDIIMRAKNCIDESATDGSVRIKAEKHLEMLGGNAGSEGGVLIESKSRGDFDFSESGEKIKVGGLIVRASDGTAVLEGVNTYIRSGIKESGIGNLVLDAGQPNGCLTLSGGIIDNYISKTYCVAGGTFDSTDSDTGEVTSILHLQPGTSATDPGNLTMSANVLNTGTLINKESIICGSSVIVRNMCATLLETPSMVLPVGSQNVSKYEELFSRVDTALEDKVEIAQGSYDILTNKFYMPNSAGNFDCVTGAEFSYRTEEEYAAYDFKLYSDRWQNIAYTLELDANMTKWSEKKVNTLTDVGKYPYPGDKFYDNSDELCLVCQLPSLYNGAYGEPYTYKQRSDTSGITKDYTEAKYAEPTLAALNEYLIIGGANG